MLEYEQYTQVYRWWVYLGAGEKAALYLSAERMRWLQKRLRAGQLDLPDSAADRLFSVADLRELRRVMVERDLADGFGMEAVRIRPGAAEAILRARSEEWGGG